MFQSPGNIFITIGNLTIYNYSVCIALAILVGSFVSYWITKKYYTYLDENVFYNYTPAVIISALIGARAYYVYLDWDYFSQHLSEIPMMWHGGMAIHGAIAGGILIGYIKAKIDKISFIEYCDAAPWGVIVGQAIGRWGNFFNSEAFGLPTNLPWKLYIPEALRPTNLTSYEYFHPTFLYESIWNIIVFFLLFFVFRRVFKNVRGGVFFTYLILYSFGRILIESIRIDTISYWHGIAVPTLVSIITIVVSACILAYITINADKFKKHNHHGEKA